MKRELLGKILSYILVYSYYVWFWILVALVLTVLVEGFLCPNFRIEGLHLYILFGATSKIMCGEGLAVSNLLLDVSVSAIFLIILYSLFMLFLDRVFKVPILAGEYKIKVDPITKLIFKGIFKLFSKFLKRR